MGTSGSGKTTLARELARRLGYRHIELDAIHWQPNWIEMPTEDFRTQLEPLIAQENWTMDGNYSKVRDMIWQRADTLVWLEYSLPVIFWRLGWRSLKRVLLREELWNGNREDWGVFIGYDSLFTWVLRSQPRHRREYPLKFQQPEFAHLQIIHLHSPRETDAWLKNLQVNQPADIMRAAS